MPILTLASARGPLQPLQGFQGLLQLSSLRYFCQLFQATQVTQVNQVVSQFFGCCCCGQFDSFDNLFHKMGQFDCLMPLFPHAMKALLLGTHAQLARALSDFRVNAALKL